MSFPPAIFYHRTRAARKIVVVDLGFLGDSVHLLPALAELRRHYPEAQLHTLSAPVGAALLELTPSVTRAWAFPLGSPSPPWWRHWDLLLALRRQRFDLALTFSGTDRSLFMTALTGARWRLACAGGRRHFWNRWLIGQWVPRRSRTLPVYEQRRQVLAACGMELNPPTWELHLPESARQRAEALVPAGALHCSINASHPLKEWPLEHWVAFTRALLQTRMAATLVASGSEAARERERLRAFAAQVNDPRCVMLPADLGVAGLAAVLRRCRWHIGGDSGVLHLAAALGTPTVALVRDYPAKTEWLPQGPTHPHLVVPCECVDASHPPCAAQGRARCLQGLAPETVLEAFEHLGEP
jgi:lipopolysaccharide heptosyltransferase III